MKGYFIKNRHISELFVLVVVERNFFKPEGNLQV